jgi:uncharacterized repeat protein (TIGR01451 family)
MPNIHLMRKIYTLLLLLLLPAFVEAQIVNIPDANFKEKLLASSPVNNIAKDENGTSISIDSNNDQEIQQSELYYVYDLDVSSSGIADMTGIESFTALENLNCSNNQITNLHCKVNFLNCSHNNISELVVTVIPYGSITNGYYWLICDYNSLDYISIINPSNITGQFDCSYNDMDSLNISGGDSITILTCEHNNLTSLDFFGLTSLDDLSCSYNHLQTLDLASTSIYYLYCDYNDLVSMYLKNDYANNPDSFLEASFSNNPYLTYICARTENIEYLQGLLDEYNYTNCEINSSCVITPPIQYHLNGTTKIDINNNGCDGADLDFEFVKLKVENGSNINYSYANSGQYFIPFQEGTYTVIPVFNNPNLTASPPSVTVTFPGDSSDIIQNFCITQVGEHPDVEVSLVNIGNAIPGFDTTYRIFYSNKSFDVCSGTITFDFNDATLDVVAASPNVDGQSTGQLFWNYINLQPFETRDINITLNLNSPVETPPLNQGEVLHFTATANNVPADEYPADNISVLNHTVFNAFDPNDKTCLEGDTITPQMVGEYVHYKIRFENTGNYPAAIVTVKDIIDTSKFDISTLTPITASHPFITRITDTNQVEFVFDNIMLPFDDANNDGYVVFKIRTKPTLVLGEELSNTAGIYFNYNAPVITNTAVTTVATPLGINENENAFGFALYPNPAKNTLHISSKTNATINTITIYNTLGQQVMKVLPAAGDNSIDISRLPVGGYIVKVVSESSSWSAQFIKE